MAYFDSNGVQIYFEEHGNGEPVVLVHGFASRAEHNWGAMNWFTTLGAHYRVIALDCRGHGKSGKPHDPAAYGGETMGDDVIRLMDHLGIKRTLIMGYSMGARIVTGLLMLHPERLRAAVLGGIGAATASAPSFDTKPYVDALLAENISSVKEQSVREFRQSVEATGNDLKALAACMPSRGDFTAERIAAQKIRVPVMIVIGTKDLLVGNPKLLHDAIPGSKLVMLEGRDHLNAPGDKLYKEAVLEFFNSAPA
ncbi:MAG TPA: alpha/beta hydrolase [Candidatus Acidoferrum sp.]|nr:alpha/beta hydrolase [Candidatus Acidoferrum sp.]